MANAQDPRVNWVVNAACTRAKQPPGMLKQVQNELHENWVTEDALLHVNEEMWAAMRLPPSLFPNIGLAIKLMNGWKDGAEGSKSGPVIGTRTLRMPRTRRTP